MYYNAIMYIFNAIHKIMLNLAIPPLAGMYVHSWHRWPGLKIYATTTLKIFHRLLLAKNDAAVVHNMVDTLVVRSIKARVHNIINS